jgi:FtsP/CotA-like multicopper oxidase with cupredoxin domain
MRGRSRQTIRRVGFGTASAAWRTRSTRRITQEPIQYGSVYRYEFTAVQSGTYLYHAHDHVDRQQALGLYGAMIIDPREDDPSLRADHDYTLLLQEWLLREGLTYPAMPMAS